MKKKFQLSIQNRTSNACETIPPKSRTSSIRHRNLLSPQINPLLEQYTESEIPLLICSIHGKPILYVCIFQECQEDNLLCHDCYNNLNTHRKGKKRHLLNDFREYILYCYKNLPELIIKEKDSNLESLKDLEKFMMKSGSFVNDFIKNVEAERNKICVDFDKLLSLLKTLEESIFTVKTKMINYLLHESETVKKHFLYLKKFSQENIQNGGNVILERSEKLFNTLRRIKSSPMEIAALQKFFKNLVSVCCPRKNKLLLSQLNFNEERFEECEEKEDFNDNIHVIFADLKNKMTYYPKYKFFQNSEHEFNNFLWTLEDLNAKSQHLNERLLMSKIDTNLKLDLDYLLNFSCIPMCSNSLNGILESRLDKNILELHTQIKTDHSKGITCLSFIDDDFFVTGSSDSSIKIFDFKTFRCHKMVLCEKIPYSIISFKLNGKLTIATGHSEGIVLILNQNFAIKQLFQVHESVISSLIILKDCRTLVSSSFDSKIIFYDLSKFEVIMKLSDHIESVNCLDYLSSDNLLVSGSDDCTVKVWVLNFTIDSKSPAFFRETNDDSAYFFTKVSLRNSIDCNQSVKTFKICLLSSQILVTAAYNIIKLYDLETGTLIKKLPKDHNDYIYKLAIVEFPVLSMYIKSRSKTYKKCFEFEEGFPSLNNRSLFDMILPNGYRFLIISFCQDHKINIWDTIEGKCIFSINDKLKDMTLSDPFGGVLLAKNKSDDKIYVFNTGDKDNVINVWALK